MQKSIKIGLPMALNQSGLQVMTKTVKGDTPNVLFGIATGFVCNIRGKGFHFSHFSKSSLSP